MLVAHITHLFLFTITSYPFLVSTCITIRGIGVQRSQLTTAASDLHILLKEGKFEWPASFPKNKFARTYSWRPTRLNLLNPFNSFNLLNLLNLFNLFNPFNPFNPFNQIQPLQLAEGHFNSFTLVILNF